MSSAQSEEPLGFPTVDPVRNPQTLRVLVTQTAARHGWQSAATVIQEHWDAFAIHAPDHLLTALKALPGEAFIETPGLLVAANYLQHVSLDADPRRFFHDNRLTMLRTQNGEPDLNTLILLTGQSAGARTSGRLDEARNAAQEARDALQSMEPAARSAMYASLPHLRFQWGRSLDAADADGAVAEYEEAFDLAQLTNQSVIARRAAGHIAWFHAERGRLRLADLWLARSLAQPATNGRYDVIVFLTSALLKYDRGEEDAARDLARALGLRLGEQWAAALWLSAMLEPSRPGAASVHAHLEAELERHPEARSLAGANGRYIKAAQARLARLRPKLNVERAASSTSPHLDVLLAASAAYRRGHYRDALTNSKQAAANTSVPRVEAPALLITAASHHALGHDLTASDAFKQANGIIEKERLFSAYSFLPDRALAALGKLSEEPIHGQRARDGDDIKLPKLTKREREIVDLLTAGLTMTQIATELYISPNTLKSTIRALYRKLNVNSRSEAVDLYRRAGPSH